jgi:CysZ protein
MIERGGSAENEARERALAGSSRPGFGEGVRCFFRGFSLVFADAGTLGLATVPVLVAIVLMGSLASLGAWFVPDLVLRSVPAEGAWGKVLGFLATALAVALGGLVGLALAKPASGPALEAIVRRVEARLGLPERPNTPFWLDVRRSLASSILALAIISVATFALFVVSLVPGVGIVAAPLDLALTVVVIGWDLCDVPLSARGLPARRRLALVREHLSALFGFASAMALCSLVPCGLFLMLPIGVAGATELVARMDRQLGSNDAARGDRC